MMEAVRTSETSVDNHFTRQYIPEDNSEQFQLCFVGFSKFLLRTLHFGMEAFVPQLKIFRNIMTLQSCLS
jgi:hypothetical protein